MGRENEEYRNGGRAWRHVFADVSRLGGLFVPVAMAVGLVLKFGDLPRRFAELEQDVQRLTQAYNALAVINGKLEVRMDNLEVDRRRRP